MEFVINSFVSLLVGSFLSCLLSACELFTLFWGLMSFIFHGLEVRFLSVLP